MPTARLTSTSATGSSLRWTLASGLSYRAYDVCAHPTPSFCVSTRSHEAVFVLEGEVELELGADRRSVRVRAEEAAIVSRGLAHRSHSTSRARFLVVDLPPSTPVSEGVSLLGRDAIEPRALDVAGEAWLEQGSRTDQRVREQMGVIAAALSRATTTAPGETHHSRRMQRVKAFLESSYGEAVSLDALATAFHLERHYLLRSFKRNFGIPPLGYVQFLRTEHFVWEGLRRAARGAANHTRTALEAGFGDYPTFSRRIHDQFGKPPSRLFQASASD